MTDEEWSVRFEADFGKLVRNRSQVPLEKLQTVYKKGYQALVDSLTEAADWFADRYLQLRSEDWPRHPRDAAGNEWLDKKIDAIVRQEERPGGLAKRWRAALIEDLDVAEFERLVMERYVRCEREAFEPYWQRHNLWVGPSDNRWIYNDIIGRYWLPPGAKPEFPEGAWISNKYEVYTSNWPPTIGPDKNILERE